MASTGTNIFKLRTFCVITGASRGLGRQMAVRFSKRFPRNTVFVLVARDADGLQQTKCLIEKTSPGAIVRAIALDLSTQDETKFDHLFQDIFQEFNASAADFEQALIVHNAASMGDVSKKLGDINKWRELQTFFDLNLTSVISLNSVFLKHFTRDRVSSRVVVNISSICALQPFKTWSLYCASKAARDMLFRTMALEEPDIRVLNYAPGPLDTEMQVTARTETGDTELRNMFSDMHLSQRLLSCDETINKLTGLLEANKFDSGAHIDYYDI